MRIEPVFLFDLDGTLVDSVYQHVLARKQALDAEGIELSVWRIHRKIGMSGGLRDRHQRPHGTAAVNLDSLGVDPDRIPVVTRDQVKYAKPDPARSASMMIPLICCAGSTRSAAGADVYQKRSARDFVRASAQVRGGR